MSEILNKRCVWLENVLLAPYSTYKIGGPAKYLTRAASADELKEALLFCRENDLYYYILGKGSNTLFDDRGFDGAVILNAIRGFEAIDNLFHVWSGTSFSRFGAQCSKLGYGGLEYAIGIPGTLGGAVFMNAGASGQEISSLVESVDYIHETGEIRTYSKDELVFKYRWTSFHEMQGAIVSAKLRLYRYSKAREKQINIIQKRRMVQPYDEPSCGCIFRNGEDYSTGKLIDELGLKGLKVGGAEVSSLHANFIVNSGNATANDVKALIEKIEKEVLEKKNIILKKEIRFVPYHKGEYAF